mmetsp:Transcript_17640/g.42798  ORF Transcript_17640/g.42798 Transcript_17640/m.42798 type:complete len:274 (+) Transcript_17640:140-961(+)
MLARASEADMSLPIADSSRLTCPRLSPNASRSSCVMLRMSSSVSHPSWRKSCRYFPILSSVSQASTLRISNWRSSSSIRLSSSSGSSLSSSSESKTLSSSTSWSPPLPAITISSSFLRIVATGGGGGSNSAFAFPFFGLIFLLLAESSPHRSVSFTSSSGSSISPFLRFSRYSLCSFSLSAAFSSAILISLSARFKYPHLQLSSSCSAAISGSSSGAGSPRPEGTDFEDSSTSFLSSVTFAPFPPRSRTRRKSSRFAFCGFCRLHCRSVATIA